MAAHGISCSCPQGIPDEPGLPCIDVALPGANLQQARIAADQAASATVGETMLLAWYDGKTGNGYPDIPECSGKPAWFAYGVGHGAKLMVSVNDKEWVFLYLPLEQN
jgi:hypothetical protein